MRFIDERLDHKAVAFAPLFQRFSMLLELEVLRGHDHSVELFFLISLPALLDNDVHRKVLNEFKTEAFKSVSFSDGLQGTEKAVSLIICL